MHGERAPTRTENRSRRPREARGLAAIVVLLWTVVSLLCVPGTGASQEETPEPPTPPAAAPQKAPKSDDQSAARDPAPPDDTAVADLVEKTIGQRPRVLRSEHLRIITLGSEEEARSLLALGERIHADFVRLVGEKPGHRFWKGTADEFLVSTREQYRALVRSLLPRRGVSPVAVDYFMRQESALYPVPSIGISYRSPVPPRNIVAHHMGHFLLSHMIGTILNGHYKTNTYPSWLVWGFSWHLEHEYTHPVRFTISHRWMSSQESQETGSASETYWPKIVADRAAEDKLMSFSSIKKLRMYSWDIDDQAQIWALVRFLVKEHPGKFARWIKLMKTELPDTAFRTAFGWTDEQVDRKWSVWIRANLKPPWRDW